ncbi:Med12 domain-containing protein [Favolaschia claudopus]|uniref:Mediator of RNA polymerase II transcription subunit 12 n=1 Tax=Favolaschia claudopus TaxID=2862362 RepID=A0AAW0E0W6_9AGAR
MRDPLPLYDSQPPEWLPKSHLSGDLGYPGFHPPRPNQDEDVLTAENVKNGFILPQFVDAERFSAKEVIHETMRTGEALHKLELLMNDVFKRRFDRITPIPASTFRMPTRVTLNDSKRHSWLADLANPDVPLHKLGKSVPHGAKGHDLLDLLQSNRVAIPRAVWFLRVLGANETAGLRNKPSYNPTQYSIDWANVVTGYMKKQLADIALPSAPRPGLNIKQTFKGVLADADTRERWISRFSYSLELLRPFYLEGLVDSRTFLVWLVQQMVMSNLAQVGFLVRIADEYLEGIMKSRPLAQPFVDASLCKLSEIRTSVMQEFLVDTEALLKVLLRRVCLGLPDAFVSPGMWSTHAILLEEALTDDMMDQSVEPEANSQNLQQLTSEHFEDIKRRNEAMLFTNLPSHVSAKLRTVVSDVQSLNSISSNTDMASVTFFSTDHLDDYVVFSDKLQMLLTWSVTPLQFGDHRPFAAVTLIRNWRAKVGDRATRRDFASPDEFLQDQLFDWLDTSDVASDPQNLRAVSVLYGKLVKDDLFSYAGYIQRLIARGEGGLAYSEVECSRHRDFLRCIPLYNSTSSLTSQRKVTLYGARTRETPEDLHEREIRKEIRALLPDLFNAASNPSPPLSMSGLLGSCSSLVSAPRFEQVRIFRTWLLPLLQSRIVEVAQDDNPVTHSDPLRWYSVCAQLMVTTKCFSSVLELIFCVMQRTARVELFAAVIDTLRRFTCIWNCMNATGSLVEGLFSAHQRLGKKTPLHALLDLLEFDDGRYLDSASRSQLNNDISELSFALRPPSDHPVLVPDILPEILLLADDLNGDAPSSLAGSLWIKYRVSLDWAWKVWDNTVASLREIPVMFPDASSRRICALRYAVFLWHVDRHLPKGLDEEVLRWFLGRGQNDVAAFEEDAWGVLSVVLIYLSVHGALQTTTILKGLVYPAWQLGASASNISQGQSSEILLRSVNALFRQLLLQEDDGCDDKAFVDLLELQRIRTRRQAVYQEPHFSMLVSSVPLLVNLESNENLSQNLRKELTSLRLDLSEHDDFRHGAFRNLDAIRETFEHSLQAEEADDNHAKSMVAALRIILSDPSDDDAVELSSWPDVTSLLSPWKLAATSIHLQFILRQIGRALSCEGSHAAAQASLDKLILMIFHHSMTSEQAYFVAQMARGTEGVVAGKFINNGLKTVTEILRDLNLTTKKSLIDGFERTGELLRVIAYVAEPLRAAGSPLPTLDSSIQVEFLQVLHDKFVMVEQCLMADDVEFSNDNELTHAAISLSRLLQFHLGFPITWSAKIKELGINLSGTIFRLVMLHGGGSRLDMGAYSLLVDTLYYLLDELSVNAKMPNFDPFAYAPAIVPLDIPSDFPREYRNQIQALLRHSSSTAVVSQLALSHRDSNGSLYHDGPVLNRPWEWIENLGEAATLDAKDEKESVIPVVKNSGSLSLELFGARLTGDRILSDQSDDDRIHANLETFQDGLSADAMFKRDWRATRMEPEVSTLIDPSTGRLRGETNVLGSAGSVQAIQGRLDRKTIPRTSPASSVLSRSSAHGSTGSRRPSPAQSSVTRSSMSRETADPEGSTGSSSRKTGTKRKLASDDDTALEGTARTKKQKTKATNTKPRAKKR